MFSSELGQELYSPYVKIINNKYRGSQFQNSYSKFNLTKQTADRLYLLLFKSVSHVTATGAALKS